MNQTRTGRRKSISLRASRQLKTIVKNNSTNCLRSITELFNTGRQVSVSQKTVRRNLHYQGFRGHKPCKNPLITRNNILKRLDYYNNHRFWVMKDCKVIIFSDESRFNLFQPSGRFPCVGMHFL